MEQTEETNISTAQKFFIFLRGSCYVTTIAAVLLIRANVKTGYNPFAPLEVARINEQLEMTGQAIAEIQDYQVAQASKKGKK